MKKDINLFTLGIAIPLASLVVMASTTHANEDPPAWSYGGTNNPTQWGEDYEACAIGRDQSPIDIDATDAGSAAEPVAISFDYQPTTLAVTNNGHTIQVDYEPGSTVTLGEDTYNLLQFHFHTPSEHTIEGDAAAMEVHFVHINDAEELAVVGVMMTAGAESTALAPIWENIPAETGTNVAEGSMINAADLLPEDTNAYFSYAGSLTTPPCSEQVRWNVLTEPITVSPEQVNAFSSLYQVNARPIQPVNGRAVELQGE